MRKNQKGFTLVELIIAVAILAIVTAAVCGFIVVGSRSYASSNTDIMLQQDAQLALNQMSDVIIDTTDSISYGLSTSGSGDMQLVLKDSEFAGEATEKCLIVVNKHEDDSANKNPSYWFYWSKDAETIYFNEVTANSASMTPDQVADAFQDAETDKAILAQHVTDFSIDISQFEANRVVMIAMTFENGNRTYSTSNNVTVRNRIALNEITVGPMKRAQDFEINAVRNITMEPGESLNLRGADARGNIIVEVNTSGDDELTWEIIGAPTDSTLGDDGHLTVGQGEISQSFNVKVSRKNEEYTGQNDRVAQTIKVNVKRATSVAFNAPSTAKQGDTVELKAWAEGNLLKQPCNGCVVSDAALLMDRDVDGWDVEGDAEIKTSDSGSASVLIHSTAKVGDTITVKAYSKLSWDKNYGPTTNPKTRPVWGEWKITVQQGTQQQGDAPIASDYKFGTDNDDRGGVMYYDYMYDDMPIYTDNAVVCARVREMGETDINKDQVILYWTSGRNIRFYPDMFGLELNRSYQFYMQIIVPVQKKNIPENNAVNKDALWESDQAIISEYYGNLDSVGKYVGENYYYSKLYYGTLTPPMLAISVSNGGKYPNDDADYYEHYSLISNSDQALGEISIDENDLLNVLKNTFSDYGCVKFTIYKDENGTRKRVCGYNPDKMQYESYSFEDGLFSIQVNPKGNPTGNPFIKRDINHQNPTQGVGTYYVLPGYEYANYDYENWKALNLKGLSVEYHFIDKRNIRGDFAKHYYEQPRCTITWKVDTGLNLQLPNDDIAIDNSKERWTIFPLPTDSDFPFELQSDMPQTISRTLKIFSASGKELTQDSELSERFRYLRWPGATITCEYNSTSGKYKLTVATEIISGKTVKTHIFGVYVWQPGDSMWQRQNAVESDNTTTITTNLAITKDGVTYDTYFPSPSEGGLTYENKEKTTSYRLLLFKNDGSTSYETVTVKYQLVNGKYQVTFSSVQRQGRKRTTYTYNPITYSNNGWGSCTATRLDEAIWDWDSLAYFTNYGTEYKVELDNPPAQTPYTVSAPTIYKKDDTYGEWGENQGWLAIDYTYDSSTGTYTARFRNGYWDDGTTSYAIYTYNKNTKKWIKIQ